MVCIPLCTLEVIMSWFIGVIFEYCFGLPPSFERLDDIFLLHLNYSPQGGTSGQFPAAGVSVPCF